ncbi:hypothetical protein [Chryseobacterium sp.]|uniref:hypothetical protein n=1 Tax=Chryseobacterium sp. TaxID=1871047 RepID=UPI00321C0E8A
MKRNFLITFLLSLCCFISIKAHTINRETVNSTNHSPKALAEVCFNRVHNGWAEIIIPVSQWASNTVTLKIYGQGGSLINGANGVTFDTNTLTKVSANGKEYYFLKGMPIGGNQNGETFTYEVSSPQDAAVSKTFAPLASNEQANIAGASTQCIAKAAVCFNRVHNGWAEIIIPVSQWTSDKVILKIYGQGGSLINGANGVTFDTNTLTKVFANGKEYYFLKGMPIGGNQNGETFTYEVSGPQDAAVSKTFDPLSSNEQANIAGASTQCIAKAAVCFNRVHNGWAEIIIPVSEWTSDKVILKIYGQGGSLINGGSGVTFDTNTLTKVSANGKEYYFLKGNPVGGVQNGETFTYEVSGPKDAAVSKTFDPLSSNEQANIAGASTKCIPKAAVCFNRVHNGWAEIIIPVNQWVSDKVILKIYGQGGSLINGANGVTFDTNTLTKVSANGKEYYFLKGRPVGGVQNGETFTYEVSGPKDAAVSKTFDSLSSNEQANIAGASTQCIAKAPVCFNRLHNGWAEMIIPVSEWASDKVILKIYGQGGDIINGGSGVTFDTNTLTKVSANGKEYYFLKGRPVGGVQNGEIFTYEVRGPKDAAVSKTLDPVPSEQWSNFEKQKTCITKAGGICVDRNQKNYTMYIPVSEWKGTDVRIRFFNINGDVLSSQDFASPSTEIYNGRNCYKISGNAGTDVQVIIEASSQKNAAVHMVLDTVQSLCYEGACGGNNNWELTGNTATDPSYNFIGTTDKQSLVFKTNNVESMRIDSNGKIGIGTKNLSCTDCSNYRLFVKDGIKTEKVKVEVASANGWADYVFHPDYQLLKLEDVEKHIREKGHLPNIPSAEEVVKKGIDLAEMDAKLLEKIEELTLYTINLNKKNTELHQKNAELGGKVKTREEMIKTLLQKVEVLESGKKKSSNSNTVKTHE